MNYEPIGQDRFAKFDHSISRMRIANDRHEPGWYGAFVYCLKRGDNEAAKLILDCSSSREGSGGLL